ncbi:NADH-quinone oxidoreductase subunit NuoI [Desulfobulbus oligotrophicus]|jgi:NADH-quinone oxidoreductase subunit I|uniref:NADH-quinone oxidoreductase subunit I n=1 Tax=Desulfobulbus oligotrophicus TaxID=1909699 RepID=A0A7T5VDY7_9BACT|nr:NADH-quinone oxidoreductase subunit NuoI [Desulfobulbus oligotrophicus]MDY0391665.1 NADH-quinone oxidoreductase subunit NuoI [Desulfobulbus oligotrophicus]QQG66132.1 NADH-quinone oxidoreductase subunit NuoI [Desulfobulbus oligotrophicus]
MQIQYKPPRGLLATLFQAEIVQGMALTLKRLFSKPITRQYPDEKPDIRVGFRGQHALVRDPETGDTKCIGCMRCAISCPSRCIRIRSHKDKEPGSRRVIDCYRIEALRCVYCGFCEEVCPVNALVLTEVFEYSSYDRPSLYFTKEQLLGNWDRFVAQLKVPVDEYVNPYWRPRGVSEAGLPAGKRKKVSPEWSGEQQVVGRKWRQQQSRRNTSEQEGS